jgi:hypothetical protein
VLDPISGTNAVEISASVDAQTGVFTLETPGVNRYLLDGSTWTFEITCTSTSSGTANKEVSDTFDVTFEHECAGAFTGSAEVDANSGFPINGVVTNPATPSSSVELDPKSTNNNVVCG